MRNQYVSRMCALGILYVIRRALSLTWVCGYCNAPRLSQQVRTAICLNILSFCRGLPAAIQSEVLLQAVLPQLQVRNVCQRTVAHPAHPWLKK